MLAAFVLACSNPSSEKKEESIHLTAAEKKLADSLRIDSTILIAIREKTDAEIQSFHVDFGHSGDSLAGAAEKTIPGITFNEEQGRVERLSKILKDEFREKGYSIFTLERNYGYGDEKDIMAVLKTKDKFEVLKQVKTDGINYGIDNDSVIRIVQKFDRECELELIGAGYDWCEFSIKKSPGDWMQFAEEVYLVCPDIVDQGTGTVEALAEEMRVRKRLYFWWD